MPAQPPEVAVKPASSAASTGASTPRVDAGEATIEDWITSRLRVPKRALKPLGNDTPKVDAEQHGAVASGAWFVEDPTQWLLVHRFRDQRSALAAVDPILKALDRGPPYSNRTSVTGAYLLVIGFASHKPVSPEMESAQNEYLSAFAGEE